MSDKYVQDSLIVTLISWSSFIFAILISVLLLTHYASLDAKLFVSSENQEILKLISSSKFFNFIFCGSILAYEILFYSFFNSLFLAIYRFYLMYKARSTK